MSWNNPDAHPGESESEYLDRKEAESRSTGNLIGVLVNICFILLKITAVLGLFIFATYFLSEKLLGKEADKFKVWGFTLLFTYLILCIIFFLKGIVIGLRTKGNKLWILPWGICVLLCCITPAYMIKHLVLSMFPLYERKNTWSLTVGWGAFIISTLYIYSLYQFKTPNSPRIFHWIFKLGFKAGR